YNAYASGLNLFVAHNPKVRPRLLAHFEPWYPLALIRYKYYQKELLLTVGLRQEELGVAAASRGPGSAFGSNAWAISPTKSASGYAMLFIIPHVSFFGIHQYSEAHL